MPFINGTWRIENCFAATGRAKSKTLKVFATIDFSHDTFQSKRTLITHNVRVIAYFYNNYIKVNRLEQSSLKNIKFVSILTHKYIY